MIKLKETRVFDGTKVIADIVDQKVVPREGFADRRGEIVAFLNSQETPKEDPPKEDPPKETPPVIDPPKETPKETPKEDPPVEKAPAKEAAVSTEFDHLDMPPESPFVHETGEGGHPYMISPEDVGKIPFGLQLTEGIPLPPKLNPEMGTKTPAFMHWMAKHFPTEFKKQYHKYYARQKILKDQAAKKAAQVLR